MSKLKVFSSFRYQFGRIFSILSAPSQLNEPKILNLSTNEIHNAEVQGQFDRIEKLARKSKLSRAVGNARNVFLTRWRFLYSKCCNCAQLVTLFALRIGHTRVHAAWNSLSPRTHTPHSGPEQTASQWWQLLWGSTCQLLHNPRLDFSRILRELLYSETRILDALLAHQDATFKPTNLHLILAWRPRVCVWMNGSKIIP